MSISRAPAFAALAFALFSNFSSRLAAQVNATATFSGQVTDGYGAAVAGATVKITSEDTGVVVTRQTATDGIYTIPLLKPGAYTIEVTASGFGPVIRKNITLQIQQVAQEDFKLAVGTAQQEVTVEGGAPLLNTEATELGSGIDRAAPSQRRNFSQLSYLVPGTNQRAHPGQRE